MSHLPTLVLDLGLILITAAIITILFKWLKQPVVLGYIIAGFLVSQNFFFFPTVVDTSNIATWSEIGVIFLLFALGLEFSFKKLVDIGGTASIGTAINMGSMIVIGYIVGQLMGWTQMESLFLGGMLAMSSTTIIIKAFTDMGLQKKRFAGIVFGMLIVEDIAAIIMMVLFSTLAVSQKFEGVELMENILKLLFFILIWFVVGIYLIPTVFKKLKKYLNDETLLIVSVGLCIGMVIFADAVGFSPALGAFIMGIILAETVEGKHIEHLMEPLKNLFGAVFFVSVGMMISPDIIVEYIGPILLLTVVVLVGRIIFATLGVLASGEGLKVAMQSGFSLAQIGEFSFIVATLGLQLGVLSDFIYPIIVAVSVITTFTTPYCIKLSVPAYNKLEKIIPPKWNKLIIGYSASSLKTTDRKNDWNKLLKDILLAVAIYFALSVAVLFLAREYLIPFITDQIPGVWGAVLAAVITLSLMMPFMSAILRSKNNSQEYKKIWEDSHFNKAALIGLTMIRIGLCAAIILVVLIPLFPEMTGWLLLISIVLAISIIFFQGFSKQSERMEEQFFENLNSKEIIEEKKKAVNKEAKEELLNRDIHIEKIIVPQNSRTAGHTLAELNFRQVTGVDVISIIRGTQKINIPSGDVRVFPFDKLVIAGTDEEIQKLISTVDEYRSSYEDPEATDQINLSQYEIKNGSPLIGKSVIDIDLNLKEETECMVIGIDRNEHSVVGFNPSTRFEEGDILWLAGEKDKLNSFEQNLNL